MLQIAEDIIRYVQTATTTSRAGYGLTNLQCESGYEQNRRRLLGQESGQEGRRNDESVSHSSNTTACLAVTYLAKTSGDVHRLLEVFNKLLSIAALSGTGTTQNGEILAEAKSLVESIRDEHICATESFIQNPELRTKLADEINEDCQELIDYIVAAKRFNLEVNSRSKDKVVSFGEKLSCRYMAYMLRDRVRRRPKPHPSGRGNLADRGIECRG